MTQFNRCDMNKMTQFNRCQCFVTHNVFLAPFQLHVQYHNERQFWDAYTEASDSDFTLEHVAIFHDLLWLGMVRVVSYSDVDLAYIIITKLIYCKKPGVD